MNDQFATAMDRALQQTRAGNPMEATRILQAALNEGASVEPPKPVAGPGDARPTRRPLGQVVDSLVSGKTMRGPGSRRPAARPAVPDGARYERRLHESAHGARDCRVFIPSARPEPVRGLVLMLHGCTQNADDFAAGTRMNLQAERHNLIVVYPDQTRQANHMGCWNWFRPEDQGRGRGEPALLADLATAVALEHSVPRDGIFAAGLSAGAAMAAILGVTHPEVFTAIGAHSGLAPGSASDVTSAFAAMRGQNTCRTHVAAQPVRSIVFHGSADTTVAPVNAEAVISAAMGATPTTVIEDLSVKGARIAIHRDPSGRTLAESWALAGIGHAWSGGSPEGSYTSPSGPDASAEMVRFFLSVDAEDLA